MILCLYKVTQSKPIGEASSVGIGEWSCGAVACYLTLPSQIPLCAVHGAEGAQNKMARRIMPADVAEIEKGKKSGDRRTLS